MTEEKSIAFLVTKALFALATAVVLLLFALIMGTFATDSPSLTGSQSALAFAMFFFPFATLAFWPVRAFFRAIRDMARQANHDDRLSSGENDAD